jgi:hypothetical protein
MASRNRPSHIPVSSAAASPFGDAGNDEEKAQSKVYSDPSRSEHCERRGLDAPESHRRRNRSSIARVIRTLKGSLSRISSHSSPQNGMGSGSSPDRPRSAAGEADPSGERRLDSRSICNIGSQVNEIRCKLLYVGSFRGDETTTIIPLSKPPPLPGDRRSLTFRAVCAAGAHK